MKPSIFRNELLAVADPLHTVIFEGLWCAADREGRLEDRPARIHLEINPGRAFDGTQASLEFLAANGFIFRYEVDGAKYIQVVNFTKHQNPHQRETASVIPPPQSSNNLGNGEAQPRQCPAGLTPDSGLLTPESIDISPAKDRGAADVQRIFDHWRSEWKHPRAQLDDKRKKLIKAALKLYTADQLCLSISGYLKSSYHTGKNERGTVYSDIELFLRDAKHIDAGLKFAEHTEKQKWQ